MPKQANYRANVSKVALSIVLSSIFTHDSKFPTNENRENANVVFSLFLVNINHIFQGFAPYFLQSVNTNSIPQMSQIEHCMKSNVAHDIHANL